MAIANCIAGLLSVETLSNIKSVVDKSKDEAIFYNALEAKGITKDDIKEYFKEIL